MDESFLFQAVADDADAPVHHVARCDDVGAGTSLSEDLFDEHFDRFVVEDVARFVDETVLAVRRVGVECDVAHDAGVIEV